jgi:hypothetical protein
MKKWFVVLFSLLLAAGVRAQLGVGAAAKMTGHASTSGVSENALPVIPRDILKPYEDSLSSMLTRRDDWHPFPRTPEEWRRVLPDSVLRRIIRGGEAELGFEFKSLPATLMLEYLRTGNRTRYENVSFGKRNALWRLILAESAEGQGRFTDKIIDGIWSICEESYWGVPAHLGMQKAGVGLADVEEPTVDLFTAETAAVLAWADYFNGAELDKVSPLIRNRLYDEVSRRVFVPLQTAKYGYLGAGKTDVKLSNWAPWVMSNYCTAALLLEKDSVRRVEEVRRAMHYTDLYIDGLGEDGGCEEGPTYWTAAGGCVFDMLCLLKDASLGRINVFGSPIVRKMAQYIYIVHIAGDYYVNIADAAPQFALDGPMVYRFGKAIGDPILGHFGSWLAQSRPGAPETYELFHRTRTLYNLLALADCNRYPPSEPSVERSWLSGIQLMAVRGPNGLFLASHGGTNGESHNHNDVGDFLLYKNGRPVIIDVGSGTYTARTFSEHRYDLWFNTSAYHNLPTINGYQQHEGAAYAATKVEPQFDDRDIVSLRMDIAGAYPAAAGVASWVRTVRLETGGQVSVTDRYSAGASLRSLTQSFLTVDTVELGRPGVIVFDAGGGQRATLDYDATTWMATVEKVEFGIPEEQGVRDHWEGRPVYRVLLTAKKLSSASTIRWVFR